MWDTPWRMFLSSSHLESTASMVLRRTSSSVMAFSPAVLCRFETSSTNLRTWSLCPLPARAAASTSPLVTPCIAETTTTIWLPSSWNLLTISPTRLILSPSATLTPPNLTTILM